MVYHSKTDVTSIACIFLLVWIVGFSAMIPFMNSLFSVVTMSLFFIISGVFLWWYVTSIKYVFYKKYLLVKGGPFRRKVPYQNITKVSQTTDKFTGYRISASEKGLELFVNQGALHSIKVLPTDKINFISELEKRCPNIQISIK
ncbi:PH domain-containing protein [Rossellomorea aquimaris]|nr:PH domain-containing protein [Rossellomorea aquimaris]WRP07374.1 PH domain-containing protein [Rossellomorea aquimaris]